MVVVGASGVVTLDTSGCHDCGFASATGRLTSTGVQLLLAFKGSGRADLQTGVLGKLKGSKLKGSKLKGSALVEDTDTCALTWRTNSTDQSGHWATWTRRALPPPPPPPPPPPASGVFMGYTMATRTTYG